MKNIINSFFLFFTIVGFSQTANLDPSFGNGGVVILDAYSSMGGDLTIQSDGKILVAGYDGMATLIRFNADGTLDNTFNAGDTYVYDNIISMAVQPDGKIVAIGGPSPTTIIRFNSDGSLDNGFGVGGKVNSNINSLKIIKVDPLNNKIVVGGYNTGSDFSYNNFAIGRFNTDGSPDISFNGTGIKTWPIGFTICDLQIDSSHKISAAGYYRFPARYYYSYTSNHWLCRVNEDGTMDTSFSTDGILVVDEGSFENAKLNQSNAMIMKPDGSLIIAGTSGTDPYTHRNFSLYEVTQEGNLAAPDMPFSYDFANNENDIASSMAVDYDGKLVLAGITGNGVYQNSFALLVLNLDYSVDTNFGINGRVTTFPKENNNRLYHIAIQPDNKIVAVGTINLGPNASYPNKLCLTRYLRTSTPLATSQFENNPIQISPNPVSDIMHISVHDLSLLGNFYEIVDINGKQVLKGNMIANDFQINVECLAQGFYFLKTEKNIKSQNFIKE